MVVELLGPSFRSTSRLTQHVCAGNLDAAHNIEIYENPDATVVVVDEEEIEEGEGGEGEGGGVVVWDRWTEEKTKL